MSLTERGRSPDGEANILELVPKVSDVIRPSTTELLASAGIERRPRRKEEFLTESLSGRDVDEAPFSAQGLLTAGIREEVFKRLIDLGHVRVLQQ